VKAAITPAAIAIRRLRYGIVFAYWAMRHRSVALARWICAYEGL
jgi:hypothetical protein